MILFLMRAGLPFLLWYSSSCRLLMSEKSYEKHNKIVEDTVTKATLVKFLGFLVTIHFGKQQRDLQRDRTNTIKIDLCLDLSWNENLYIRWKQSLLARLLFYEGVTLCF